LVAAEILEHDHPPAATILYRALLDDILNQARSPAYGIFALWGFSTATPQQALLCSGFAFQSVH
jgi:hypothetical protein